MCWLIQNPEGYSKIQARKESTLDFRLDFSELRFNESSGVYSVYAIATTKPEGCAALPKEKGTKWDPEFPLKVCFNLDSEGSDQEKAAIKVLSTLDGTKTYSGYLCIQNTPFVGNIISGKKADGSELSPDMLSMLMDGLGAFKEVESNLIKDEDVKAIPKGNGFAKKFKSKGEIAEETLTAIKSLLGKEIVEPTASFIDTAMILDGLPNKQAVYDLLNVLF
jgi:hypothetical protein